MAGSGLPLCVSPLVEEAVVGMAAARVAAAAGSGTLMDASAAEAAARTGLV